MKLSLIFFFLFLVILPCFSQVLIKGRIIDSSHPKVVLYEPINNYCNNQLIERPDFVLNIPQSGFFEKNLRISFPCVITVKIDQMHPVWLFVEPGDTITIEIQPSKFDNFSPNNGISIKGKNAAGNEFYNVFNYSPRRKFTLFERMLDSLNFRKTLDFKIVDYVLSKILYPFDSLFVNGKITKAFYDVITGDTKGVLIKELVKFAFFEKKLELDSALVFINRLYTKYPVTDDIIKGGLYGSSIAYYYYYSKARKYYQDYHLDDSLYSINGKEVFIGSNFVHWLYAPKDIQEMQWAISLIEVKQLFSSSFGKKDVEAFLAFYPDSKMKEYLSPPYFSITELSKTYDSSAFVFKSCDNINSFASLISNFKGRKIFVDFWATWCTPCKFEFSHNAWVDSFCTKNNILRLYVAFEMSSASENLKKNVYEYNLRGIHVIANKKLIDDIVKIFYPGQNEYNIPHYILVNENGEIVNADASRPSSDQLFSEMKSAFKLSN